jgi:hypothetical protein
MLLVNAGRISSKRKLHQTEAVSVSNRDTPCRIIGEHAQIRMNEQIVSIICFP